MAKCIRPMNLNCKKCNSTMICTITQNLPIKYKSDYIAVPFDYSVCINCNHEFISTEQIKMNDENVRKAKLDYETIKNQSEY